MLFIAEVAMPTVLSIGCGRQPPRKETTMNARLIATALIALSGATAFAAEGEQWVAPTGTLTRAEVRAELARAQAAGEIVVAGEAWSGFAVAAPKVQYATPAEQGKAVARAAAVKAPAFNELYVGG
jgi:hypothetical protein